MSVDLDHALLDVVEAADQVHDGRFSGTGRSHEGDRLAGIDVEAHIVKDIDALLVGESDMLKINGTDDLGHLCHALRIHDLRVGIEYLKDPLRAGDVGDQLVVKVAQVHDRLPEHGYICAERDQCSHRYIVDAEDHDARKPQRYVAESPAEIDDRAESVRVQHRIHKRALMFIDQGAESLLCLFLGGKALDDADAGHILMHKGVQIGRFFSENLPPLVGAHLYEPYPDDHERNADQRGSGKLRVFDKHDAHHRTDRDKVRDQGCDTV